MSPRRAAVSPFRQRGSKNIFQGWMFNGYKRLASQAPYWIVPFAIGACPFFVTISTEPSLTCISAYGTYTWAKRYDVWQNSKAGHVALHGSH
jgi:ubiquinol-cytochrome c reductase subunit 8